MIAIIGKIKEAPTDGFWSIQFEEDEENFNLKPL